MTPDSVRYALLVVLVMGWLFGWAVVRALYRIARTLERIDAELAAARETGDLNRYKELWR